MRGATAYAGAVGWPALPAREERTGARWRAPDAVAPEDRIHVDGAVVGRVVRPPGGSPPRARYGFELARPPGQTFAASVHQFHRVLATASAPRPS